jgi:hypothetical protein
VVKEIQEEQEVIQSVKVKTPVTVFDTSDGKKFKSKYEAERHEASVIGRNILAKYTAQWADAEADWYRADTPEQAVELDAAFQGIYQERGTQYIGGINASPDDYPILVSVYYSSGGYGGRETYTCQWVSTVTHV